MFDEFGGYVLECHGVILSPCCGFASFHLASIWLDKPMGEFFVWLEERTYSGLIASGVKPYIQEEWRVVSSRKRLVLRYRWPGYEAGMEDDGGEG